MSAPVFIPETHRKGVHLLSRTGVAQTGALAKEGTVEQWEHWDGSVDANVRLRPFRIRLRPDIGNDPQIPLLIAELEQAIRANETALHSGDRAAHRRTAVTVGDVKRRLTERMADG